MSFIVLARSDDGVFALLLVGGLFVAMVIACFIARVREQKKEDNKPKSRILGFAPRDLPKPEPEIPDRIKPVTDDSHRRSREGPVEPPPDVELPAPPPKQLPPRDPE